MADVESYERSQNKAAAKKATSGGDITDRGQHKSKRQNFSGPRESKSGEGVRPKASGSPWKYGRSDQAEANYSADYSRTARSGKSAGGSKPFKPSDKIPESIYGDKHGERGNDAHDHI